MILARYDDATGAQLAMVCSGCCAEVLRQPDPNQPPTSKLVWDVEVMAFRQKHSTCGHQLDLLGTHAARTAGED